MRQMFLASLRRLVQADRHVPDRTSEEIAAEVERNYRWNFSFNLLDGASFWFGISFISSATIAPLFISKLTDSALPVGIVAALAQGGWFLPQLFTANAVERLARKKPAVIYLGFLLERVPMWVMVSAAILAGRSTQWALILFLVGYAWRALGGGVVATAWQDLIARCFPVDRRGRFWGITSFVGNGAGIVGAGVSAWLLRTFPFPTNFVYTFALAATFLLLSMLFLAQTREPAQAPRTVRQTNRQFLAGLPELLRRDHNFGRFLGARLLLAAGQMGAGFVTVSAVARWQIPDSTVGIFTSVLLLGQTLGTLTFGLLSDRHGHKLALELGALASLLAFLLAWLAPSAEWLYAVFILLGVTIGSIVVSGILVVMEFSSAERRPTYMGLTNTGVGLVGMAAPLIGATLAGVSYGGVFLLSAVLNVAALVAMHWGVKEPRWNGPAAH